MSIIIGYLTSNTCSRNRFTSFPVCDCKRDGTAESRCRVCTFKFEKVRFVKGVKGKKDMVALCHLLLTASYIYELVVDENAPEFGCSLNRSADTCDEVFIKLCTERSENICMRQVCKQPEIRGHR